MYTRSVKFVLKAQRFFLIQGKRPNSASWQGPRLPRASELDQRPGRGRQVWHFPKPCATGWHLRRQGYSIRRPRGDG